MNNLNLLRGIILFIAIADCASEVFASTNYVSLNGGNIAPYDTWAKAAVNIQDAIDISQVGIPC